MKTNEELLKEFKENENIYYYWQNKDYENAQKECLKLLEYNSESYLIYYFLGLINYELQNKIEAIKNFDNAIELNNNFAEAYFHRGICYMIINNFWKAFFDINCVINFGHSEDCLYNLKAINYNMIGFFSFSVVVYIYSLFTLSFGSLLENNLSFIIFSNILMIVYIGSKLPMNINDKYSNYFKILFKNISLVLLGYLFLICICHFISNDWFFLKLTIGWFPNAIIALCFVSGIYMKIEEKFKNDNPTK